MIHKLILHQLIQHCVQPSLVTVHGRSTDCCRCYTHATLKGKHSEAKRGLPAHNIVPQLIVIHLNRKRTRKGALSFLSLTVSRAVVSPSSS